MARHSGAHNFSLQFDCRCMDIVPYGRYSLNMAIKKKQKKFAMRMRADNHRLLMVLSDLDQISMTDWLERQIVKEAKKRGVK